jgi:chromosome segregation ATPase
MQTKYNSLLTSDRSGNKRTCISSPATAADSSFSPIAQSSAAIRQLDRNSLLANRSITIIEREVVLAEQNRLRQKMEEAAQKLSSVIQEHDSALRECQKMKEEHDEVIGELEACRHIIMVKEAELILLRESAQAHGEEMNAQHSMRESILSDASRMKTLLDSCTKQVKALTARVAYLESTSKNKFTVHVPTSEKNKSQAVKRFASKLYPSLKPTQQLTSMFDQLYNDFQSFTKHVKSKLKMDVEAKIKMETCRDIKKLFAPWRILEVVDLSQQSLNQVRFIVVLLFSIIQFYVF